MPSISANLCTSLGPCLCTLNWLMNSSLGWWALQEQTSIRQHQVDLKYEQNLLWLDAGCVSGLSWLCSLCERFCAARIIFWMWKYVIITISHKHSCCLFTLWLPLCFTFYVLVVWLSGFSRKDKLGTVFAHPIYSVVFGKVGECCTVNNTRTRRQASSWSTSNCQRCPQRSNVTVHSMVRLSVCVFSLNSSK